MDQQVLQARRHQLQQVNQFRQHQQKIETHRDFKLHDPRALEKELPIKTDDQDSRIGVSSLQRFEGEDLGSSLRQNLQKTQIKLWTEQQIFDKQCRIQDELNEKK